MMDELHTESCSMPASLGYDGSAHQLAAIMRSF